MGKRQDAALETKKKIIKVVKELLEQKSPEQISIEEITKKAGIAKGSFYTHFKRKEDVISQIDFYEYTHLKKDASMLQGILQQLTYYLCQSVKTIEENSLALARQWMKGAVAPVKDETAGVRKYQFDYDNILSLLKEALDRGEIQSTLSLEQISDTIMNYYYGAVASWCILGQDYELIKHMEHFCHCDLKRLLDKGGD